MAWIEKPACRNVPHAESYHECLALGLKAVDESTHRSRHPRLGPSGVLADRPYTPGERGLGGIQFRPDGQSGSHQ